MLVDCDPKFACGSDVFNVQSERLILVNGSDGLLGVFRIKIRCSW